MTEQEKIRLAQREYKRKWRAQNPEKVAKHVRNYWLKQAEKIEKGGNNSGIEPAYKRTMRITGSFLKAGMSLHGS